MWYRGIDMTGEPKRGHLAEKLEAGAFVKDPHRHNEVCKVLDMGVESNPLLKAVNLSTDRLRFINKQSAVLCNVEDVI